MPKSVSGLPKRPRPGFPFQWLNMVVIVGVLVVSLLGPNLSIKSSAATGEGSALRQILYVLAFALAAVAARPWQQPGRMLVMPITMVVALAWCALSVTWAIDPGVATRRLVLTTLLIWTIFLVVRETGYERTVTLFRRVLLVALVVNFLAVLLVPSIGVHPADSVDPGLIGAWRGVLVQKNFAGAATAVTLLLLLLHPRDMPKWQHVGAIVLSCIFLVGTVSKTSMGIGVLAFAVGMAFRWYTPRLQLFFLPLAIVVVAGIAAFINLEAGAVGSYLEQDQAAFTGRAEIWMPLMRFVGDNPFTGSGYGSFWNIGNAREPIHSYATGWVTVQTSGHNGYLDLMAQTGIPGLILGVIALFIAPIGRLLVSYGIPARRRMLLISLFVFCIGHNVTESSLLERDIVVHVFLQFTIALVAVAAMRDREPAGERARGR